MCGRYSVSNPGSILPELLDHDECLNVATRYNVAPSQRAPVVVVHEEQRRSVVEMRWGLIPNWAEDPTIGQRMINARAETVGEKRAFRDSLLRRRCVVAADGFYEWQKVPGGKQAYFLRLKGGTPFGFAGLWDRWCGLQGQALETFTILTTVANELLEPIHSRMPVILGKEQRDAWLSLGTDVRRLNALYESYPATGMETFPVSDYVNDPAHDSPRCLQAVSLASRSTLF